MPKPKPNKLMKSTISAFDNNPLNIQKIARNNTLLFRVEAYSDSSMSINNQYFYLKKFGYNGDLQ